MKSKIVMMTLLALTACGGQSNTPSAVGNVLAAPQANHWRLVQKGHPFFNGTSDVSQSDVGNVNGGTSVSCVFGSNPTVNNTLVFIVHIFSGANTTTAPTGVTQLDAAANSQGRSYYREVQSGDGKTWTFTASASSHVTVSCLEIAGADTTNPIDQHGSSNFSNVSSASTPSETPSQSGDLPIVGFGESQSSSITVSTTGFASAANQPYTTHAEFQNVGTLPVAGTGAVSGTASFGAASYGGAVIVLLKPAATTCSPYKYHNVQVFNGTAGTCDSVIGADVSGIAKDTNSDTVINNTKTIFTAFGHGDSSAASEVNLATSTTPQITVSTDGGHSPPVTTGAKCGSQPPDCKWYHDTGFVFEGQDGQTCTNVTRSGDCHYEVLNTDTQEYDTGYHAGFGSSTLVAGAGNSLDLNATFASQESIINSNWGLAGIPGIGFIDYGEDEALSVINHPLKNFIPVDAMWNDHCGSATTNYAGTTGCTAGSTCTDQTKCLMIGDVLVLNNNDYSSLGGCTNADSLKVIAQLEKSGSPVTDTDGATGNTNAGFYFGLKTDGTNPWPAAVFTCLGNLSYNTTNWHIITRGSF